MRGYGEVLVEQAEGRFLAQGDCGDRVEREDGFADDQAVPAHQVVFAAVHPAVFIGFRIGHAAPFDVGVQVLVPIALCVRFGRIAHLFIELDARVEGKGKRTGSPCGPRHGFPLLPVIGQGEEGPMVFEVVLEFGTRRVGGVALEEETVPGYDVSGGVFLRHRFEVVDGEFGVDAFLAPLPVAHVIWAHGDGVALEEQEVFFIAQGLIEHGEVPEAVGADDVLFRGRQYRPEDDEGKPDVGDACPGVVPPTPKDLHDVIGVGGDGPKAGEQQGNPGGFPGGEVVGHQEGAGQDHGREQAAQQFQEQAFPAVLSVAQELGEGRDADEQEGQGHLHRVVGGIEIRARGEVVGGQLAGQVRAGGFKQALEQPTERGQEVVEDR